jgi:tetratricopeptide (TPR) repeat protein
MSNTVIITQPRIVTPPVRPAALLPNLPTVPPLDERDDVIVIRPKAGGVRNLPPPRAGVAKARKAEKPFDPPPILAPRAKRDAGAESARQMQLGKEAFAAKEYGRALERFEQALELTPNDAMLHFLRAQAEFALGKYADATASVLAGLKLRPEWPKEKFAPRELYGRNAAEAALHLDQLRQAVETNPNEPALLFLYGYQLWFDGRRGEAREFLRRALPMVADPKPIERFLQEPAAAR